AGLYSALRAAADRPAAHPVRARHPRHHPAQTAEDRRAGESQRAADQGRLGVIPSDPARLCPGLSGTVSHCRPAGGLSSRYEPDSAQSTSYPVSAATPDGGGKPRSEQSSDLHECATRPPAFTACESPHSSRTTPAKHFTYGEKSGLARPTSAHGRYADRARSLASSIFVSWTIHAVASASVLNPSIV